MTNQILGLKLNELLNQSNRHPTRIVKMTSLKTTIDDLILNYSYYCDGKRTLSIDDLTSAEIDNLLALQIDENESDTSDLFYKADKLKKEDELTDSLVEMLKNKSKQKDFINAIRQHIFDYYFDACAAA